LIADLLYPTRQANADGQPKRAGHNNTGQCENRHRSKLVIALNGLEQDRV
jgi:hypothetical protein